MKYPFRDEILNLKPYVAGKPIDEVKREFGLDEVIKLASNENPLGISEKVKEALRGQISETELYPDASNYDLRHKIAEFYNVKPEEVFCSTGCDMLIRVISQLFVNEGDEVVAPEVTFSSYEIATKLMGGRFIKVPMKNNAIDIDEMLNSITQKTKVVWFCNPNNPTGTIFGEDVLLKILKNVSPNVMVIMDEAYAEFVEDEDYPNSFKYFRDYPNLIILKTFSKVYGLASLRCGYGIADEELVKYFNRVIGPFDVNAFAQKAAVAAMDDQEFVKLVQKNNSEGKKYLYKSFEDMGLEYIKTNSNFIIVNLKTDDVKVFNELLKRGVIIRPGTFLGMPGWLRVSIGLRKQNEKFVKELKSVLNK